MEPEADIKGKCCCYETNEGFRNKEKYQRLI